MTLLGTSRQPTLAVKDVLTEGARNKHPPLSARQPPQPHGLLSSHPRGESDVWTKSAGVFPSPSPAHLLSAAGMPPDVDPPVAQHRRALQRLRVHRPVLPTPAPCEEQKLLPSTRKCVCLHVKSHICIQQIKTLSVVQMH